MLLLLFASRSSEHTRGLLHISDFPLSKLVRCRPFTGMGDWLSKQKNDDDPWYSTDSKGAIYI